MYMTRQYIYKSGNYQYFHINNSKTSEENAVKDIPLILKERKKYIRKLIIRRKGVSKKYGNTTQSNKRNNQNSKSKRQDNYMK